MKGIRVATSNDAIGVADLHYRVWRPDKLSAQDTRVAFGSLFSALFIDPPAGDTLMPSLVYEDAQGAVAGFLGIVCRPMRFRDKPIRMVVATQFMLDDQVPSSIGLKMLRQALEGPQDISYVDMANPRGARFAQAIGFVRLDAFSRHWLRPIRPIKLACVLAGQKFKRSSASLPTRAVDPQACERFEARSVGGLTPEPITADVWMNDLPKLMTASFVPVYDTRWAQWISQRLCHTFEGGIARGVLLRSSDGQAAGWYIYQCVPGQIGQVAQVLARPGQERTILSHLISDARAHGLAALAGRIQPGLAPALRRVGCLPLRRGDAALAHSKDADLIHALKQGDAFLTRLEGEGALNLHLTSEQVARLPELAVTP